MSVSMFRPPEEVRDEMYRLLSGEGIDPDSIPWAGSSDPPSVTSGQAAVLHVEGPTPGDTFTLYNRLLQQVVTYEMMLRSLGREFSPERIFYACGPQAQVGLTMRWRILQLDPAASFDFREMLYPTEASVGFELLAALLVHPVWAESCIGDVTLWMPRVRWANPQPAFRDISLGASVQDLPGGQLASIQADEGEPTQSVPSPMFMGLGFNPSYDPGRRVKIFIKDDGMDILHSTDSYTCERLWSSRIPQMR